MDMETAYWAAGFAALLAFLYRSSQTEIHEYQIKNGALLLVGNAVISVLAWSIDASTSINGIFFALFLAVGATVCGAPTGWLVGYFARSLIDDHKAKSQRSDIIVPPPSPIEPPMYIDPMVRAATNEAMDRWRTTRNPPKK